MLELKEIKLELFGIPLALGISEELENKVKKNWNKLLVKDLNKNNHIKIVKETIKERLNKLLKDHLRYRHGIELKEVPILIFFR